MSLQRCGVSIATLYRWIQETGAHLSLTQGRSILICGEVQLDHKDETMEGSDPVSCEPS